MPAKVAFQNNPPGLKPTGFAPVDAEVETPPLSDETFSAACKAVPIQKSLLRDFGVSSFCAACTGQFSKMRQPLTDEAGRGAGQSHFKIWEESVLKGHGFSRAEEIQR